MQNSIENNLRMWDQDHSWPLDGDEWDGQARVCGQPYQAWKDSIVETFLHPHLGPEIVVLEIGPGHGRWSEEIVGRCRELQLVDLSPTCLEFCRERLREHQNLRTFVTRGRLLEGIESNSIDFVWSYDAFVHMDRDVVASYVHEIGRVLRPEGKAVLHHAGRRHAALRFRFLRRLGAPGRVLYQWLSIGMIRDDDGWRSDVSRRHLRRFAQDAGLAVVEQISRWGPLDAQGTPRFGVPRFRDAITTLERPSPKI